MVPSRAPPYGHTRLRAPLLRRAKPASAGGMRPTARQGANGVSARALSSPLAETGGGSLTAPHRPPVGGRRGPIALPRAPHFFVASTQSDRAEGDTSCSDGRSPPPQVRCSRRAAQAPGIAGSDARPPPFRPGIAPGNSYGSARLATRGDGRWAALNDDRTHVFLTIGTLKLVVSPCAVRSSAVVAIADPSGCA